MSNLSLRDPDTVTAAARGRQFWRALLLAGGSTRLPRWTREPVPGGGALAEETVLWVGIFGHDGLAVRLKYRTDVLDADCAARIAGYHVTALGLIAADPDAEHARQSLLSSEERYFQLDGLAGPRRTLPDRRVHEVFEE